jgi:hypothetical protein
LNRHDVVICSMPGSLDDSEYHGHAGLRKLAQQWTENFDDFGFELRGRRDAAIPWSPDVELPTSFRSTDRRILGATPSGKYFVLRVSVEQLRSLWARRGRR